MPADDSPPVAVITGALSGIGEATARTLSREGFRLALLARRADRGALRQCGLRGDQVGHGGWSEALRQELQPDIRVVVIEPGAVATELTDHITHGDTRKAAEQLYKNESISAEVIAFALARPRGVSLNEILIRPTGQAL